MRKFVIDMTMSYDFQVTIEAESEEESLVDIDAIK